MSTSQFSELTIEITKHLTKEEKKNQNVSFLKKIVSSKLEIFLQGIAEKQKI
jgi:hypothetical protein